MAEQILDLPEISKHKTKEDLWIILYDKVYDISSILSQHPGGEDIILKHVAKSPDLTEPFERMQHSIKARNAVSEFVIGSIENAELKNDDNGNKQSLFSKMEANKPTDKDLLTNIWDYEAKPEVVQKWGNKKIIGWGDLFSVKIEMLDNQHQSIIDLMNKMVNKGDIQDLNRYLSLWDIHCETEQYLFDVYNFEQDKKQKHIENHDVIRKEIKDKYDELLIKYDAKLNPKEKQEDMNTEPFECMELISFVEKQMASGFKKHAFDYDSLYVDKFGDKDPSIYVKWEKSSRFNLMKPVFPQDEQLAIFQDKVYGNNQLRLKLQKNEDNEENVNEDKK